MKNVAITIDGQSIRVPENYSIIQAAEKLGIEIPRLCYDPTLEVVGSCRLCIVEIEGNPKLQTSCSMKVSDGMVIYTESKRVVESRKVLLQLLLDNHPNDCLTCQKAGECYLQKYSYKYDVKFRQHDGAYRPEYLDTSSPYILRDASKCILCGKCVRTCDQVSDRRILDFANRGFDTTIVADSNVSLEDSNCVSCNRCVTMCPVGALVDNRSLGKSRPWEVKTTDFQCKICEYGCEFEVLSKKDKNVAVRAKSPDNGRPLCLKGRLTAEFTKLDEPQIPYMKEDGKFKEVTWDKALGLEDILGKLAKINCDQGK